MNLYIIVIERVDTCPDWVFVTSKKQPTDAETRKIISKEWELDENDFDWYLHEYWVEKVYANGYEIKLIKENK